MGRHVYRKFIVHLIKGYYKEKRNHHSLCYCVSVLSIFYKKLNDGFYDLNKAHNKWFVIVHNKYDPEITIFPAFILKMAKQIVVKYFEESEFARGPEQTTEGSAGYDLYPADTITILPQSAQTIPLDLRWAITDGFFGQIMPRSSILVDHLVTVDGGVIDSDFRGIVRAILVNLSKKTFTVRLGHRIAQVVLIEKYNVKFEKVSDKSLLGATKRGSSGFGSTGLSVIKKTKLDDWLIESDDKNVSDLPETPESSESIKAKGCSSCDQPKLIETEEELQIVSEEATMKVNDKIIIHDKITID